MYYYSSTNDSDCCQCKEIPATTYQKMCYKTCSMLSMSSPVVYASIHCAFPSNFQHQSKRQQIKLTPKTAKVVIVYYLLHHENHIQSTLNKQTEISMQNSCNSHRKLVLTIVMQQCDVSTKVSASMNV